MAEWVDMKKATLMKKCSRKTIGARVRDGLIETKKHPDAPQAKLYKKSDVEDIEVQNHRRNINYWEV